VRELEHPASLEHRRVLVRTRCAWEMSRFYFEHCVGFTCEASGGNAAGVVLPEQDRLLNDAERQAAAKVLDFSETVFVSSIDTGLNTDSSASVSISLRYMTPLAEVDLCGHATIACLGLLHASGRLGGTCQGELHTRAGEVGFRIEEPPGSGGDSGRAADAVVFMQQLAPYISAPLQGAELKELAAALGVSLGSLETWSADWAPRVASTGLRDLLVQLPSLADLRALNPSMHALARLSKRLDVVGLHAFCAVRGAEALHFQGVDYHVRNFAPRVGIDEEAATGTSNCALACALQSTGALPAGFARRDAACRLYGLGAALVFAQGDAMGEPSRILVQLPPPSEPEGQPWVGGRFALRGGSVARHASPRAAWRVAGAAVRLMGCVQPGSSPSSPVATPPGTPPRLRPQPSPPMLPASLLSSSGGGRTVAAAAARAGVDSKGREAPAPLAPGVLRFDPLDIALFLGVAALLYRYAMAGTDGAVGHMDASLLDI
jgi:PhzF family phenazine biosynthesis protein